MQHVNIELTNEPIQLLALTYKIQHLVFLYASNCVQSAV